MPQSLSKIHIVFSTKNRQPFIRDDIAPELFAYLAKVLYDECKSPAKIIGGIEDHIHLLINLSRSWTMADVVEAIKTSSSKWMKTKGAKMFSWQAGYSAFSVSSSNVDVVVNYIRNQKEHHRKSVYQDELRGLLKKHAVEYDERYVWD